MKIKATYAFEISGCLWTIRCYYSKDPTLRSNLKSNNFRRLCNEGRVIPVLNFLRTTPSRRRKCGCIEPRFLNSVLVEGEWSASRPGRFTSRERAVDAHWIGDWVAEPVWKSRRSSNSLPYWDSNSDPSVAHSVASRYGCLGSNAFNSECHCVTECVVLDSET
jgi:hypothetical protein